MTDFDAIINMDNETIMALCAILTVVILIVELSRKGLYYIF